MPSTDRDVKYDELDLEIIDALACDAAVHWSYEQRKAVRALITQKQKEAQLYILQKVNTIRKGESASVEVIAKHVSEELTALQSPDREEDNT